MEKKTNESDYGKLFNYGKYYERNSDLLRMTAAVAVSAASLSDDNDDDSILNKYYMVSRVLLYLLKQV
jgi:hypothetical protein